ncbi:MAG TPA: GH3 auxin-responsive promoter family protein [Chitinophagales bacterium]|nr:GH3 auxin-responsive promoter family protein [Chitinophagales bacterium]
MLAPVVHWFLRQRAANMQLWIENPLDEQEKVFHQLIQSARDTEWGKKFEFSSIKSQAEFSRRIPLQDYESLKPFFQRIMHGEQNILWNTTVKWFAKSAGTTSDKSKYIPLTREAIEDCHFKGGIDLVAAYCACNPETKLLSGKGVIVGGSHQPNPDNNSISSGDLSAVLLQNMSWFGQLFRTPDLSVALMNDWEKKLDALAHSTMNEDITNISGVPTWTMLLIKRVMELKGKENLSDVWSNIELYMHGGVSFNPYHQEFESLIRKHKMHYYQTYNASEGFFAFQYGLKDDDMLLHVGNGIFFEFIPSDEIGKENPKTVFLHEVTANENYGLVISTNGGLWRYIVGDTIRFTSLRPFKIQVTGRLKHFINAFGEEVIVDNADRALEEACRQTDAVVNDYTVAPIFLTTKTRGGHEWLIEFSKPPGDLYSFTKILDDTLRNVNSDYDAKRQHDLALALPVIHSLPRNTFYQWLKSKNKLGGQNKVPRLSNDRKFVEEILGMMAVQR